MSGISGAQISAIFPPELMAAISGVIAGRAARPVHVVGARSQGWVSTAVMGDAADYLDTTQSNINVPTVGQTLYLVSTNAADTAAGAGARTVRTTYLDANGYEQTRTDALAGLAPVNIGAGYTAIQRCEVATVGTANGTAAGNITISSTNGAATVATTFEQITAGGNASLSGRYVVPTGFNGFVPDWSAGAVNQSMDCRLRADCFFNDRTLSPGVFHFQDRLFLPNGSIGGDNLPWLKMPAGCTIKISAIPGGAPAGNRLDCDFTLLLIAG
jgi:hypothetical protein